MVTNNYQHNSQTEERKNSPSPGRSNANEIGAENQYQKKPVPVSVASDVQLGTELFWYPFSGADFRRRFPVHARHGHNKAEEGGQSC